MKYLKHILIFATAVLLLCLLLVSCRGGESETIPTRDLVWGVGAPLPKAEDFFENLPQGWTAEYARDYRFDKIGEYTLQVILRNAKGKAQEYEVKFSLINDQEPPVITGTKDLSIQMGEGVSYRGGVSVSDNCHSKVTLEVDSSLVKSDTEGEYPVYYIATDGAGNVTTVEVRLYVYANRIQVTKEMLFDLLAPVAAENISSRASVEEKIRQIYDYVYYHIDYTSHSDKSDWIRAAYDGLRTGQGDCFTYFALAKAFFEYYEIENMDIQRTEGIVEGRHYWNLVNIGTADQPRWYHFDATQLSGIQHSGCLLTDVQVQAYSRMRTDENGVNNFFYAYDTSSYPKSDTEIITPTPSLEPYY